LKQVALKKKVIGIDLMGSDAAPNVLLDALKAQISSLSPNVELVAIGTSEYKEKASFLRFYSADEAIQMDEHPLQALRHKKNSSLVVGLRLLKQGTIDAFVSAGNTGALVSAAKMILGLFPSLLRPALLALMPTKGQAVAVLDVGANLKEKASHLVQFAQLGSAYQKVRGIKNPKVGLLNIGSEPLKGTSELRLAYQKLKNSSLHFVGNVEGKSVFDGEIDVLVTDGFTGNVFLKTSEGITSFILDQLNTHFSEKSLTELRHRLYYTEYPGALLVGVKGVVVKCHGHAKPESIFQAIKGAIEFVSHDFVKNLHHEFIYNRL
jgi:glycerol-3-phosphate acyltransferase PlsX